VTQQVRRFEPHLLIVSGDLVDAPSEVGLRAAKQLLDDLAASSGAELFVVPGNHDVSPFGIDLFGTRSALFYKIFNCDTATEQPAAVQDEGGGRRKGLSQWVRSRIDFTLHRTPRSQAMRAMTATALRSASTANVLVALIDSNAADRKIGIATGSVSIDDLARLGSELEANAAKRRMTEMAYMARIMVLHHYPLPIAHTDGTLVGAEPFMVLHNGGDVVKFAARHKVDLILHGHKHRQQLTLVEQSPDHPNSYPVLVAAAGSAARESKEPRANSFNLVTIENNGRIKVKSVHYGGSMGPDQDDQDRWDVCSYTDSIRKAKRRIFAHAFERCGISSRKETFCFAVDELGDLTLEHETIGPQAQGKDGVFPLRSHVITLPKHGEVAHEPELVQTSVDAGCRIVRAHARPVASAFSRTQRQEWLVALPPAFKGDRNASYTVRYSLANSVVMTRWEAEERACYAEQQGMRREADWDRESVGCTIRHPIEEREFRLSLPQCLADAHPYLCCERPVEFPNFRISEWGDAELSADSRFERDTEMEAAEGKIPYFDKGIWRFTVKRPVVGYGYRVRWLIPGGCPKEPVPGDTRDWRKLALAIVDNPGSGNEEALLAFDSLADALRRCLASGRRGESWRVELFAYDEKKLALRPVARCGSKPLCDGWQQFSVGLGNGIAGAAFLKGGIVPWVWQKSRTGFSHPVPQENPDGDFQAMLAVPLVHPMEQDKPRPSPWGTIGVVCFSSSSSACKIPSLLNEVLPDQDQNIMNFLRLSLNSSVHRMFRAPGKTNPTSAEKAGVLD
ncbi:MAG: metallophosphoesterase, partial [Alphaproteobacteria bacterium]|nr:metallophosphoesterase [Alphaproteobacteria bacterium]